MKKEALTRKCKYCKDMINIISEDAIRESNSYYHLNCYIKEKINMKRQKKTKEEIEQIAQSKVKQTRIEIQNIIDKELLFQWLQDFYNIYVIPSTFFIKIESVYNGTYKGLKDGIPPGHILDMWKRKANYLNKIYDNNIRKGKQIDTIGRINYDLAVLINKYDSYLLWLDKNKIIENETIPTNKIDYTKLTYSTPTDNENIIDIYNILDEI